MRTVALKRRQNCFGMVKAVLVVLAMLPIIGFLMRNYGHSNLALRHKSAPKKVALLFLSKGLLYHEKMISQWLSLASKSLPLTFVEHQCRRGFASLLQLSQQCNSVEFNHIKNNFLFSTYLHIPPSVNYSKTSLFKDNLITNRIETAWGDWTLMNATRELLAEALKDPSNEVFVLLSETDIFLYDPWTFYVQLMSENVSRVNACAGEKPEETFPWRWSPKMAPVINASQWRKSSQWFSLRRKHAQRVIEDQEVYSAFVHHCPAHRCIADEHYLPTLMAVLKLEDEMACDSWGISAVNWEKGGAHPKTYFLHEINQELIHTLRSDAQHVDDVVQWAKKQFYDCSERLQPHSLCGKRLNNLLMTSSEGHGFENYFPKLTARKFDWHSVLLVEHLLFDYIVGDT